jgi:AraC-like DNA-binding protein
MDALSDILRVVRLKGGVFLHAEFTDPWCVASRSSVADFGGMLEGAGHLILYHYVVQGRLEARIEGADPVKIEAGEVVLFPRNDPHVMGSNLDLAPVDSHRIVQPDGDLLAIRYGGGGDPTRVVCGFLGCDQMEGNPLLATLPAILRLDTRQGSAAAWIRSSFQFAAEEIAARRAGTDTVLAKLSELLFVEAVRRHVETLPSHETGWLMGLKDRFVSHTLALIHANPSKSWTVDDLGREVGLSRSALSDRFARLIGEPPMRYLARWRLQVAAQRLRHSDLPMARIAEAIGYESEAAFNRAFKKAYGVPPATWRRSMDGGPPGAG